MIDEQVQGVPLETVLLAGGASDILFIDSSHVLRIGSDVQYEFLEVLPRLRPGVLVHVHDIFLPGEYPRDWVFGAEHRFWNEQYLLQAYLIGNARTEVRWGSNWMHRRHPEALEKALPRTTGRPASPAPSGSGPGLTRPATADRAGHPVDGEVVGDLLGVAGRLMLLSTQCGIVPAKRPATVRGTARAAAAARSPAA